MINDFKDLDKLFRVCRKHGIMEMDFQGIKFKLNEVNNDLKLVQDNLSESDNPYANFPDGELTPEQLMFYSSGGKPEEDPYRKDSA